ncbi:MAG: clan AA aspartic protease [Ideonella sp. WA131b]|jgi:aspartyl protease family protein|nr:clan AA aspartic protease [Ideonella sp. WA131b]
MNELPGWLKHATVWLLLGLLMFLGVQVWQARERQTRFAIEGQLVEIRRSADGHYHWLGRLAGREVEFLVDTGATGTAIPSRLADELGLPTVGAVQSATAGGVVQGRVVVGDLELEGGVRAERLRITALPQLHAPLLGMDVLGRLPLQQDRGVLRIDLGGAR